MKNKKTLVIIGTSLIVVTVLYFAFKKASVKDINTDPQLKQDLNDLMTKIDKANK